MDKATSKDRGRAAQDLNQDLRQATQDLRQAAQDARFALARAQQAAYYAHKHLIEHPGQPDAQASYRAANQRCDQAIAALRDAEKAD